MRLKNQRATNHPILKRICLFLLVFVLCNSINFCYADTYKGIVTDSITGEPLPFISIRIANTLYGDETDIDGSFSIQAEPENQLIFSFLGYENKTISLKKQTGKSIQIKLVPTDFKLAEVEITAKNSYSKKNNPAVDLIRRIIAEKNENRIENAAYYSRKTYEKTVLRITDLSTKSTNALGIGDVVKNSDTSIVSGKKILLLSLKEKTMDQYYRKTPKTKKQIITGKQEKGIDDDVFAEGWLTTYMDELFKDVDIYNSNILIAFKPFVGPLSPIAPDFYKFFIKDTVYIDGIKCINLGFTPFNSANFGFMGFVSVDDSTLAVKRVSMDIPPSTNINYIDGLHIEQHFEKNEQGTMELIDDQLTAEFYIVKGTKGFYSQRTRNFSDYTFNKPNDSIMRSFSGTELILKDAVKQDSTFWNAHRTDTLNINESKMTILLDKLKKSPVIRIIMFGAELLIKGYLRTGKPSAFDIGPVYAMFSSSAIEGFRLRIGGESTANLMPRLFTSGYLAFGFGDNKIKYNGTLEYSFIDKSYHAREFPVNSITISATSDIRTLGESPAATLSDNLFYSIKRMQVTNMMYYKQAKLQYMYEDLSGFSINPWILYEQREGAGSIDFKQRISKDLETPKYKDIPYLYHNEIGLTLRYAPREKFVQGRIYRFNLKNPYPVFELTHRASFQNVLGSQYGYQATEFKYLQRFFLSAFGRIDLTFKGGKIWTGGVAYPDLFCPNSNTSFTIMQESFSQVNPLEFVADQYLSIDIGISTNGLLFNLIPGIKKLQLREVAGFKCYWGHLSNKNNPMYNSGLLAFPGNTGTLTMEPYMEFSVGIDNIFRILRVDYVRRINYLQNPNIWANGVRVSLNFTF